MEINNIKLSIVTPYGAIFDGDVKGVICMWRFILFCVYGCQVPLTFVETTVFLSSQ